MYRLLYYITYVQIILLSNLNTFCVQIIQAFNEYNIALKLYYLPSILVLLLKLMYTIDEIFKW